MKLIIAITLAIVGCAYAHPGGVSGRALSNAVQNGINAPINRAAIENSGRGDLGASAKNLETIVKGKT